MGRFNEFFVNDVLEGDYLFFETGILLASSDDFRAVNGYDERIFAYGWDDEDLYERLSAVAPNGEATRKTLVVR